MRDVALVDVDVAGQGIFEVLPGAEAAGGQGLADAPVEVPDHAVGLGVVGLDEAVLDGVGGAGLTVSFLVGHRRQVLQVHRHNPGPVVLKSNSKS